MRTLEEVRQVGLDALARALGPVDMIRFLQQFETGKGDYTAERYALLGQTTVKQLAAELRRDRQKEQGDGE